MPISNDVGRRLGRGRIGEVDDGSDCVVTTDGGYEMTERESNWSDEILTSAIVVKGDGKNEKRECVCVNECVIK